VQRQYCSQQPPDTGAISSTLVITSGNYKVQDGSQSIVVQIENFVENRMLQVENGRQLMEDS
jgi:hypothetical protein